MSKELIEVFVVELSDNELQVWTNAELEKAYKDAEEFDGFIGWNVRAKGVMQKKHIEHLSLHLNTRPQLTDEEIRDKEQDFLIEWFESNSHTPPLFTMYKAGYELGSTVNAPVDNALVEALNTINEIAVDCLNNDEMLGKTRAGLKGIKYACEQALSTHKDKGYLLNKDGSCKYDAEGKCFYNGECPVLNDDSIRCSQSTHKERSEK